MNKHMQTKLPIDAVLAVTYNCNSRCVMCDIWQMKPHEELQPEDFLKLPKTLKYVNISGGEPFLHPKIVEIVRNVRKACPKAQIIFSSNGFATELIRVRIREILKFDPTIGVGISFDGVGEMHETIRGIPNAFEKSIKTIEMLKEEGVKNIRIAFTVATVNVEHLKLTYDLSRKLGVQFTCAYAQSSDFYFGAKQNYENPDPVKLREGFGYIVKQELQSLSPKRWARAYFAYGLYKLAAKSEQALESRAGSDFFFLDPTGIIYPSVVHYYNMGKLQDVKTDFNELWNSEKAQLARQKVQKDPKKYWMICTARTAILKHPMKLAGWLGREVFARDPLASV